MKHDVSIVLAATGSTRSAALDLALAAAATGAEVLLAGAGSRAPSLPPSIEWLTTADRRGAALREGIARARNSVVVLHDGDPAYALSDLTPLVEPILSDRADAVFGRRLNGHAALADRALGRLANVMTDVPVSDPLTGFKAFRREALQSLTLQSEGEDIDAEIAVKVAAQQYRMVEVPLSLNSRPKSSLPAALERARTLLRYAALTNDADNAHEGYNTLLRMEGAPNYNAWVGRKIRAHLGQRVLEIGAGIGTITREIEQDRELLIALEVDRFYIDRLKNAFRGKPHVRPYLSDVALADWEQLRAERIDSIVLSNVLEHIEDDADAIRRFRSVLQPGGVVVILVPALPQLYGTIDQAVGHYRRYTRAQLRALLEGNGFDVERLEWMNLVGIPGWFVNGRVFRRRAVPPVQLKLYDVVAPWLARAESHLQLPVGMSLFAVARVAA